MWGRAYGLAYVRVLPRIAAARLRGQGARRSAADIERLARAIGAIHGAGLSPDELAWADRIEAAREGIPGKPGSYARIGGIHRPWGLLLMALVRELRPLSCVELGTQFGISASYIAAGLELAGEAGRGSDGVLEGGRLITAEGDGRQLPVTRGVFEDLGLTGRIEIVKGRHEDTLPGIADRAAPIDLAFVDGSKEPDVQRFYIDQLVPRMAAGGMIVLDDIHWSRDFKGVWDEVHRRDEFDVAIDLHRLGILRLAA